MAKTKETLTDFNNGNRIIGYIETDTTTGNKTAFNFYGKILGFYDKRLNRTTNFYGKIVGYGDLTSGLVYNNKDSNK